MTTESFQDLNTRIEFLRKELYQLSDLPYLINDLYQFFHKAEKMGLKDLSISQLIDLFNASFSKTINSYLELSDE